MTFKQSQFLFQLTLKRLRLLGLLLTVVLAGCAFAPWEKSTKNTPPEVQVALAKKAINKSPESIVARKDLLMSSELAVTSQMREAEAAKASGNFLEAQRLYESILVMLPDNPRAIAGKTDLEKDLVQYKNVEAATSLLAKNKVAEAKAMLHEILLQNPNQATALALQQKILAEVSPEINEPPRLKLLFDKPISLELRDANIKVVFEALSRATGINFILDKDIKSDSKATIFIKKARIEDAIETVLATNGLQKKLLSDNTVLIFASTPQKLKDYRDLMIRSFYLSNTTAKQVAALLKTMLKAKDVFVDERLNMVVIRDTPEVIRVAEKLIAANDLEDPEVMLEVEILEVSRSRLQELGIEYPNRFEVIPARIGLAGAPALLTLEALKNTKSSLIGISPNSAINIKKIVGDVNVLSNPRIRVRNNEKAKILVGDKVPIITSTAAVNAGIAESVQYIDVGLKLDVEPRITIDDHVNIKVALEVSSLGERTVSPNGTVAFTIGTRNASTLLRLKNNETQILAGLISDEERNNSSRIPGIGDIPLIGRLFSNQRDSKIKTEIVLAITPRILSNITRPEANIIEYWSGTENVVTDRPQTIVPISASASDPRDILKARMLEQQNTNIVPDDNENQLLEAVVPTANPDGSPFIEPTSPQAPPASSSRDPMKSMETVPIDALQAVKP